VIGFVGYKSVEWMRKNTLVLLVLFLGCGIGFNIKVFPPTDQGS